MKPIQQPGEALALAQHYAIKGKLPLVLDEVVVPVHIIGDTVPSPGTPGIVTRGLAAVVGEHGHIGLELEAGSNTITEVTLIVAAGGGNGGFEIRREEPGQAKIAVDAAGTCFTRDAREWDRATVTRFVELTAPLAPIIGPIFSTGAAQIVPEQYALTFTLIPDSRLWVVGVEADSSLRVNFLFHERPLEPSER